MSTTPERNSRIKAGLQVAGVVGVTSLVVLVALAACAQGSGGHGNGNQAGPGAPGSGVVSSGPLPPPGTSPADPTPNVVAPEPAVDLHRERWTSVEPVRGGHEVLVHGSLTGGPPCAVLGRVQVAESRTSVTITLWVGRRADAKCDGPQPDIAYPFVTRVTLAEPLGEREVRDGAA